MSKKHRSDHEVVDEALNLDGDPEKIRRFYDDWADRYDKDVADIAYVGPRVVAELVEKHLGLLGGGAREEVHILDAGCGTGLAGKELHNAGFRQMRGFDLSAEMAERAADTGSYSSVTGDVDIMKAEDHFDSGSFDIIVCVGVFTLGHVPPEALEVLVRLVKPGGLLFVSTRTEYYDETDYPKVADGLVQSSRMRLVEGLERAHYLDGSTSHFWAYQVT